MIDAYIKLMRLLALSALDAPEPVAAGLLDPTAADNALRIGKQHHLQQHRRRIRRGSRLVVAKACIEARQIDLMVEQVIQGVLERPRQQLSRQIDRQQSRTRIDRLVAGHAVPSVVDALPSTLMRTIVPRRLRFFYSLVSPLRRPSTLFSKPLGMTMAIVRKKSRIGWQSRFSSWKLLNTFRRSRVC
jgi:hypothetical protein